MFVPYHIFQPVRNAFQLKKEDNTSEGKKMVQTLKDEELAEYIKKHDIVILDIYTVWCGPCKTQAAILEELSKEDGASGMSIVKMDADSCPKACDEFNVRAIPTLVLFKGGKQVKIHVGLWSKEELKMEIEALK